MDKNIAAQSPPKTEEDTGSPGQLGAASATDVSHQVEGKQARITTSIKPTEDVELRPPDIGGGD